MNYGERLTIRSARPAEDMPTICHLFVTGLLEGQHAPDEPDDDIINLHDTYFPESGGSHFWVAELYPKTDDANKSAADRNPLIIGTVGVLRADMHTAEIKRLRVDPAHHHRGVGTRLFEVALNFCREVGYLKVVLDSRVERTEAIALFERFGFQLTRTREVDGKKSHEFYLDLYRQRSSSGDDTPIPTVTVTPKRTPEADSLRPSTE